MPRDFDKSALHEIVPVILAGGQGKRLWPLSTKARPKPFLKFKGGNTFLQNTAERTKDMQRPFVICSEQHRELVTQQVNAAQIILEPVGRGTAPALAAACYYLSQKDDPLVLVLPSDHDIRQPEELLAAIAKGAEIARQGYLVTFGVTPHGPSPHYGYIKAGGTIDDGAFAIDSFVEKPDRKTATEYLLQGGYFWNSGMFLFTAKSYLAALEKQDQAIYCGASEAVKRASRLQNSIFLNVDSFSSCPARSIDYAVMENASNRAVIPVSMGWRDLGTWSSLWAAIWSKK